LVRLIDGQGAFRVVGTAPTHKDDAVELVEREHPDVCVIDMDLPEREGRALIASLARIDGHPHVLVLAGSVQSSTAYAMIQSGAAGCLMKSAEGREILATLERVASGEGVLPPEVQTAIAAQIRSNGPAVMSERELEVLRHTASGLSAHEIGDRLSLAESTVKTHLTRIYDKLGVSERAAAVAVALRSGLIE
jgi:two-component system nitrate/nitrite response regulator NarL